MFTSRKNLFLASGFFTVLAVALVVMVGVSAHSAKAASATFLIRGDVMALDKANGTMKVYFRHVNSAAEHFAGETHEISTKGATFYKYDSKQRKVRTTYGGAIDNTGYEVVVRGTVNDSNTFKADWVVRNDTTVKLRGYVRGQSVSNDYLTVELDKVQYQATGKAFKPSEFPAATTIRVHYDGDSTKFLSPSGVAMNEDEISNKDEKVTIDHVRVKYGSRFEADVNSTIRDGKWTF